MSEALKPLPIGMQTFSGIISNNALYVDKTEYIYSLVHGVIKFYFLSRPRRFGKSLLLDTIAEVFAGKRELFHGLWIDSADWGWEAWPVIRLDMSSVNSDSPQRLEETISFRVQAIAQREGITIKTSIPSECLYQLIEGLYDKYSQRVVVLIDEYDKPILGHLADRCKAEANRAVLSNFYGILKSMDSKLRFVFITGFSKFTMTSIFSSLNNLKDITLNREYAGICGFTLKEFESHFTERLAPACERLMKMGYPDVTSVDRLKQEILEWYGGYSWDGETHVFNPFSLLNFFDEVRFSNYWFASGIPGFLPNALASGGADYQMFAAGNTLLSAEAMADYDIESASLQSLLFQSGFLTISSIERTFGRLDIFVLRFPNKEAAISLNGLLTR